MPAPGRKVFYGWAVVAGAWLAMFVSSACLSSFSIFAPELEAEFGWTRSALSVGYTLNTVVIAIAGLAAGMLADRIGIRRLTLIGAAVGGLGIALLCLTTRLWQFHLLFGVLAPAGIALCFIVPTVATVRRWFMRRAALAVAVAMTGSGLGTVILLPAFHRMIEGIGWSSSYIVLGVILFTGAALGGLLLKKDPESAGTYPDGVQLTGEEIESRADFLARAEKWSVREAFSTSAWWLLALSQFFNIAVVGIIAHMVFWGHSDLGIPEANVVRMLSLLVLAAVVGRLFGGFFSDWYMARFRISRRPVLYVCTLSVALGCLLAMGAGSESELLLVSLLIGFGYGIGLSVLPAYLGDLFGVVSVPTLYGIMFFISAGLIGAIGPVLYGFIRETQGSYDLAFMITAALCLFSALTLSLIRTPAKRKRLS